MRLGNLPWDRVMNRTKAHGCKLVGERAPLQEREFHSSEMVKDGGFLRSRDWPFFLSGMAVITAAGGRELR